LVKQTNEQRVTRNEKGKMKNEERGVASGEWGVGKKHGILPEKQSILLGK